MAQVRFVRQLADGKDLVFAYSPNGNPAWAIDLTTGQQWWYTGGDQPIVRSAITENWNNFSTLPAAAHPAGAEAPARVPEFPGDLRAHRPGHAVLAKVAELHASAFATSIISVLPDEIISWSVGFVGEEATGAELARLGPDWTVLHSVPIGDRGSDIDHLVIGPAGAFCINTKHHRGISVDIRRDAVFVAGQYQHYLDNSRLEADRTTAIVHAVIPDVPVRPMLVTVGAKLSVRESPSIAAVMRHDQLAGWLLNQPRRIDPEVVRDLSDALCHSERWSQVPPVAAAPEWVAELARSLATEKAIATDQRRRRPSRGAALLANAPARRTTRPVAQGRLPSTRRRKQASHRLPQFARLAIAVGFGLAVILIVPPLLALVFGALGKSLTSSLVPHPAASVAQHILGTACSPRGSTTTGPTGRAMVCAPVATSKPLTLVWKRSA
jgi:hypothetical protein